MQAGLIKQVVSRSSKTSATVEKKLKSSSQSVTKDNRCSWEVQSWAAVSYQPPKTCAKCIREGQEKSDTKNSLQDGVGAFPVETESFPHFDRKMFSTHERFHELATTMLTPDVPIPILLQWLSVMILMGVEPHGSWTSVPQSAAPFKTSKPASYSPAQQLTTTHQQRSRRICFTHPQQDPVFSTLQMHPSKTSPTTPVKTKDKHNKCTNKQTNRGLEQRRKRRRRSISSSSRRSGSAKQSQQTCSSLE